MKWEKLEFTFFKTKDDDNNNKSTNLFLPVQFWWASYLMLVQDSKCGEQNNWYKEKRAALLKSLPITPIENQQWLLSLKDELINFRIHYTRGA